MKKLLLIALLPICLISCISNVDLGNQLHETEKLVLYCRLCPQIDTISIYLSHTQLLFSDSQNDGFQPIADGRVELSVDGVHWIQAPYHADKERYILTQDEFPIHEGGTYFIRASAGDWDDISATCSVPFARDLHPRLELVTASDDMHDTEIYSEPHLDAYFMWDDFPGEENYCTFGYLPPEEEDIVEDDYIYETVQSFVQLWLTHPKTGEYIKYFSDESGDGQTFRYLYDYDTEEEYITRLLDSPFFTVLMDRNEYLFETSLNGNDEFSSFLLEPRQTYNNITGGYGLFSAFVLLPSSVEIR